MWREGGKVECIGKWKLPHSLFLSAQTRVFRHDVGSVTIFIFYIFGLFHEIASLVNLNISFSSFTFAHLLTCITKFFLI